MYSKVIKIIGKGAKFRDSDDVHVRTSWGDIEEGDKRE